MEFMANKPNKRRIMEGILKGTYLKGHRGKINTRPTNQKRFRKTVLIHAFH